MKFLKLTERLNDREIPILINADSISIIKLGNSGKDTMIQLKYVDRNVYYFVKESVDQIWSMLNDGTN